MACTLQVIASEAEFTAAASVSSTLLVIYFNAPWAEPCKQMSTVLTTLASTYDATQPARIAFLSVDAEQVSEVSESYDITQVPFLVLQRDGKVLETVSGSDAAKVRAAVERHVGPAKTVLPPPQTVTRPAPTEAVVDSQQALQARLRDLVKAAPVMLFIKGTPSAPQCGFSRQTISILREKGIRYGFFNILADDDVRQGLKTFSDWPTFPQIYVEGELIGGLDILKEEFENDPDFLAAHSVRT